MKVMIMMILMMIIIIVIMVAIMIIMIEIILIIAAVMINSPFQPGDFPLDPPLRRNFLTLTSHYLEFISCSLLVAKFLSLCKFFTYYLLLTI